jgi:eukaryotic-like serine/threonine-protein kinase
VDCLDADTVAALLDGTIPPDERTAVDSHIDSCETCRRWIADAARGLSARGTGGDALSEQETERPARHVMLEPGAKVGRYVVEDFLGAGAMGVVYAARDPQLDRTIALKVVATGSARAARLVREAQAMARVTHPNVIPVHDAGQDGGLVFIAMQRVDGVPLRQYLRERRSARETLRLVCGAGRGLAAAHAAGIVHRDFKPDNVLVDAAGVAKVGDFGLAAIAEDAGAGGSDEVAAPWQTADGAIVGTPAYMAPEVKAGARADAKADQYSFALTVDEALGARQPRRVRRAIEQARAAAPAARFPSVEALVRALERRPIVVPALAAAALVAAVAWLAWPRTSDAAAAACDDEPRTELQRVMGPFQTAALRNHVASLAPKARRDGQLAVDRLENYAASWQAMRESTCRATRVTGEQPQTIYQNRMACLDARLGEMRIVRDSLQQIDDAHADAATRLWFMLGDLEQCTKGDKPFGPDEVALRTKLAEIHVQLELGYFDKVEPMLDALLVQARQARLPAVEAAVLLSRSTLLARMRRPGAQEGFHEALKIAERIGDNEERVDALNALFADVAIDPTRDSEAQLLLRLINDGLAALPGKQAKRRAIMLANSGNFYEDKHDFPAALRAFEEAQQLYTAEVGPLHPYTIMTRESQAHVEATATNYDRALALQEAVLHDLHAAYGDSSPLLVEAELGLGVYQAFAQHNDDAGVTFRRALAIAEKVYGPKHPAVADVLRKIGFYELDYHPAIARDAFQRAIALAGATGHAQDSPELAPLYAGLGQAQLKAGDSAAALATLEHALAQWGGSQVSRHLIPQTKFALAQALWQVPGGDHARARTLAEEARKEFLANQGPWLPLAKEVERWQKTHR